MAKKENNKKQSFSIYSLFGKISDILFIPIIAISLFSSVSMLIQRKQHKPTSFFGYSLVNILSSSMTPSGFKKGDTVITENSSVESIELGDIIAFYNYRDSIDSSTQKHIVARYNYTEGVLELDFSESNIERGISIDAFEHVERKNEKTVADAQKAKARIYFHQVIGIYVDETGNVFYKTKGSKNAYSDDYIRSDFVVGEYVETPRFLRDAMSFCSSSMGMIVLVCLPLSILVLMQCFSLIKQIEVMSIEKQLILGKRRFNDDDIQENFNGNEMEDYNKVLLYYLTAPVEREQLNDFMWGKLIEKNKKSKKEQKLFDTMNTANAKLETSDKDYWAEWISNSKGYTKKKLVRYFEDLAVSSVFNSTKKQTTQPAKAETVKQQGLSEERKIVKEQSLKETIAKAQATTKAKSVDKLNEEKNIKKSNNIDAKENVVKNKELNSKIKTSALQSQASGINSSTKKTSTKSSKASENAGNGYNIKEKPLTKAIQKTTQAKATNSVKATNKSATKKPNVKKEI